jgi:hypothetical protein
VLRSIKISGQSVMVAIRATTGRLSLSTTALALMDLNVSGVSCIANVSRFGRGGLYGVARPPELPFSACVREHDDHGGRILSGRDNLARVTKSNLSGGVNGGVVRGNYWNMVI